MTLPFSPQNIGKTELAREITVTLLLIVLYRLGVQIPLPFVNEKALTHIFEGESFEIISIFALGLMPYISASIILEIASLFIPFLKKLRRGDYIGRRKLKGYALWMTLLLGMLQSSGIIRALTKMTSPSGVPVLEVQFFYEYAIMVLVLTGGVFFLILVADLISRYGIGNGVSIILLTGICAGFSHNFVKAKQLFGEVGPSPYLLALIFVFIIALLILILLRTNINIPLRHSLVGEPVNLFQLNTCPSGTVAIPYAAALIMLPTTLFHFLGGGDLE